MSSNAKDQLSVLKSRFGYDSFRPLQEEIIGSVLRGQDCLALMPTGGGKSMCYQLPALIFQGVTLVVSPLIALMKDQVDGLNENGIPARHISSLLSWAEIREAQEEVRAGAVKLLYVAPERIASPPFRRFLSGLHLSLIAIDEAHCISEWGHEFRPDYRNLLDLRSDFPSVPVIALTATATERVREDIVEQLGLGRGRVFRSSFNRANLTYSVRPRRNSDSELHELLKKHAGDSVLIYCFSRQDTENLASQLVSQGFSALPYHAGLDSVTRRETQDKFIRDKVQIIVATVAFGMGIDKPDVRLIVHSGLPKSVEAYYQETGRAGRDGLPSLCVLFFSPADRVKHEFFVNRVQDDGERSHARDKLDKMVEYAHLPTCRRRYLMRYFGEEWDAGDCGGCDVCLDPTLKFDATEVTQKILSAVVRTEERFGANHVVDVLLGSRNSRISDLGHDRLSVYGIVKDFGKKQLKELVGQVQAEGLLVRSEGSYPTLSVSVEGWEFLRRRKSLTLLRPEEERGGGVGPREWAGEYDRALFDELRSLRKQLADRRNVPPYVIFGDVSLRHMATTYPCTKERFSQIHGVGKAKLQEYGPEFVEVIAEYVDANGIDVPLDAPTTIQLPGTRGPRRKSGDDGLSGTHEATKEMLEQGMGINEVAEARGLARNTVIGHMQRIVDRGFKLDLAHLVPEGDRLAAIEEAFREIGGEFLGPVKERLGEDFDYEELRLARIFLQQAGRIPESRAAVSQPKPASEEMGN